VHRLCDSYAKGLPATSPLLESAASGRLCVAAQREWNHGRAGSNAQILEPYRILWDVDLSPGGKRFAVFPKRESTSEQKGSVRVTVLLNFFDELRRRVPAGSK